MPDALMLNIPNLLDETDSARLVANIRLEEKNKSSFGQYMTPSAVSEFMASLFETVNINEINLLDPGSGVGSLTAAFIDAIGPDVYKRALNVDAYEIDPVMINYLNKSMKIFKAGVEKSGGTFSGKIIADDFIKQAAKNIFNANSLWGGTLKKYTHCIMNPPYKKINSSSDHRHCLRSIGIETVNLYSAFVALAINLLEDGGEIVVIIPRSFCNGLYYNLT